MLKKFNGGATDNFLTSGLINCGVFLKPHSTTEITTATHNNIDGFQNIILSKSSQPDISCCVICIYMTS